MVVAQNKNKRIVKQIILYILFFVLSFCLSVLSGLIFPFFFFNPMKNIGCFLLPLFVLALFLANYFLLAKIFNSFYKVLIAFLASFIPFFYVFTQITELLRVIWSSNVFIIVIKGI